LALGEVAFVTHGIALVFYSDAPPLTSASATSRIVLTDATGNSIVNNIRMFTEVKQITPDLILAAIVRTGGKASMPT
jgi:hypothetical protein